MLNDPLPVLVCKLLHCLDKFMCFTPPQVICESKAANIAGQGSSSLRVLWQPEGIFSSLEEGQAMFHLERMLPYAIKYVCVTYCNSCEGKSANLRDMCLLPC